MVVDVDHEGGSRKHAFRERGSGRVGGVQDEGCASENVRWSFREYAVGRWEETERIRHAVGADDFYPLALRLEPQSQRQAAPQSIAVGLSVKRDQKGARPLKGFQYLPAALRRRLRQAVHRVPPSPLSLCP